MPETIWQFGEAGSNYHDLTCHCDHHCRNCHENLLRPQYSPRARYCSSFCRGVAKRDRALDRLLKGTEVTETSTNCPECQAPTAEHVGQKNCLPAVQQATPPRGLYDLPIFGWAWSEDGKQVEK